LLTTKSKVATTVFEGKELLMATLTAEQLNKKMRERYPGEHYLSILQYLHFIFRPARYLEVGIESGDSLALALPETYAIGVDPKPCITHSLQAWTKIYCMTSKEFFSKYVGEHFDFIFIDGLHQYDAVVEDFIESEKLCKRSSMIAIHDTIPLSAETSGEYTEGYWTGDVWKIVPALLHARPDLNIITLPCQPSGLTLIMDFGYAYGLSKEIIEEYRKKDFDWVDQDWKGILNVIPNDRSLWVPLIHDLSSLIKAT